MAHLSQQSQCQPDETTVSSETATTPVLSVETVTDVLRKLPFAFGLRSKLSMRERVRLNAYKGIPDEAIATSMAIAKSRNDPDFGFAQCEEYLAEVSRLEPLSRLVDAFDVMKTHLDDHLSSFRESAAQHCLAEYGVLQKRERAVGSEELTQQMERLAKLIPSAGKNPKKKKVKNKVG